MNHEMNSDQLLAFCLGQQAPNASANFLFFVLVVGAFLLGVAVGRAIKQ